MKFVSSQLAFFLHNSTTKRNTLTLVKFLSGLLLMIIAYSFLFHFIMELEGQEFSWLTGFYWTLTVMSTLGFGDITFQSDLGRFFSIVVLLSGVLFLLVLLPFSFIEFFYAPFLKARTLARAPRSLPEEISGHIIITNYDTVTAALIERLNHIATPYVIITGDMQQALEYFDLGISVMFGAPDDPQTYRNSRATQAAMIVATGPDKKNTNIVFTAREICGNVPILALANSVDSLDILELAGANQVLQLGTMLGKAISRRVLGVGQNVNDLGVFGDLVIAEAQVENENFIGKSIIELELRKKNNISAVGIWENGTFSPIDPQRKFEKHDLLIITGKQDDINNFSLEFSVTKANDAKVLIIGSGRVGRAVSAELDIYGVDHVIVEKDSSRCRPNKTYIIGDAADYQTLEKAGIKEATTIVITTNDDDTNIYLNIYCRRLRPDVQLISRINLERNINTLYRAGADIALSYASIGATSIFNLFKTEAFLHIAEGLEVFKSVANERLIGKKLKDSGIRQNTNCNVIAVIEKDVTIANPMPDYVFKKTSEIVLIGDMESEKKFLDYYMKR